MLGTQEGLLSYHVLTVFAVYVSQRAIVANGVLSKVIATDNVGTSNVCSILPNQLGEMASCAGKAWVVEIVY